MNSAPPLASYPHLRVEALQVKLIDLSNRLGQFSYRLQISNASAKIENVYCKVNLLDCSGFLLAGNSIGNIRAAPGETRQITGQVSVYGNIVEKVGRFGVEIAGNPLPNQATQGAFSYSLPPPNNPSTAPAYTYVNILWTRIEGTVGDTYVTGEVVNSGPAAANNVTVAITVTTPKGELAASGTAEVSPSRLPPGSRGTFRQRITLLAIEGHTAKAVANWWPNLG